MAWKKKSKSSACSCGAVTKKEHNRKLSAVQQVRGTGVPRSSAHIYTGPPVAY